MIKKFTFIIILNLLFITSLFAEIYNANMFFKNVNNKQVIFIDKSKKTLYLYEVKNDLPVEKLHYNNILLGEIEGNKEVEGDKKTPEGIYRIKTFIPDDKLSEIYGTGAFPLNYPNFFDKLDGKTGYGIWIHGVNDNETKEFTQGCVAIQNNQIKSLKSLGIIGNIAIISQEINYTEEDSYNADKIHWLNYLDNYLNFWQNNDYESFSKLIHTDFINDKKQNKKQYLLSKKNLMSLFPYKKIQATSIEIYKQNNSRSLIIFKQNYCAPNLLASGEKELYLQKEPDGWKIIGEQFRNLPLNFNIKEKINTFISNWQTAWINKDIEKYIDFYDMNFKNKNMNRNSWYEYKKEKFQNTNKINVEISNLKFKIISPIKYSVTFKQKYTSDTYSDIGFKNIILKGCPGDFKIISETWKKLK